MGRVALIGECSCGGLHQRALLWLFVCCSLQRNGSAGVAALSRFGGPNSALPLFLSRTIGSPTAGICSWGARRLQDRHATAAAVVVVVEWKEGGERGERGREIERGRGRVARIVEGQARVV